MENLNRQIALCSMILMEECQNDGTQFHSDFNEYQFKSGICETRDKIYDFAVAIETEYARLTEDQRHNIHSEYDCYDIEYMGALLEESVELGNSYFWQMTAEEIHLVNQKFEAIALCKTHLEITFPSCGFEITEWLERFYNNDGEMMNAVNAYAEKYGLKFND